MLCPIFNSEKQRDRGSEGAERTTFEKKALKNGKERGLRMSNKRVSKMTEEEKEEVFGPINCRTQGLIKEWPPVTKLVPKHAVDPGCLSCAKTIDLEGSMYVELLFRGPAREDDRLLRFHMRCWTKRMGD